MSEVKKMHILIGEGTKKVVNLSHVVEIVKQNERLAVAPRFVPSSPRFYLTQ